MPNQRRGYVTENRAVNELRSRGYFVTRSSRSLGPYDIIAINHAEVLLIQCKRTKKLSERAPPRHIEELRLAVTPDHNVIVKELWTWVDRHGWFITRVCPEGNFHKRIPC